MLYSNFFLNSKSIKILLKQLIIKNYKALEIKVFPLCSFQIGTLQITTNTHGDLTYI